MCMIGDMNMKEGSMDIKRLGDYVQWYCEWCDSLNLVHSNLLRSGVACGACHCSGPHSELITAA